MLPRRRRVLFVSPYPPGVVPSQRFRFEQYVSFLGEHGFDTTFSPILRAEEYALLYRPGHVARKALTFARGLASRIHEALRTARAYDVVVIQREAIQLGTTFFEAALARSPAKVLFDFDDAIWLPETSPANRAMSRLKRPSKVAEIISLSDMVFAGNAYLAGYARRFNHDVRVVPTTIDTERHVPRTAPKDSDRVCIGWTGSPTTVKHFELALPVLGRLRERFGDRVSFKVIGDPEYRHEALGIRGVPWRPESEIADLCELDIGLMPLPDDEWAKGKCGLKALQYMALELPTVMSPVGVNTEIVTDGVDGCLASSEDEWVDKLAGLVESVSTRRRLGRAGRETVVSRYSVAAQKDAYLAHLTDLVAP